MKRFRVRGTWVDPYTWDVRKLDREVSFKNAEAARAWAKQSYPRVIVTRVEKICPVLKN